MKYIRKNLEEIKKAISELEKRLDIIEREREKLGLNHDISADLKIAESNLPIRIVLNEKTLDRDRINESLEAFDLQRYVEYNQKENVISVKNRDHLESVKGALLGVDYTVEVPAYTSPDINKALVVYAPIEKFADKKVESGKVMFETSGVFQDGNDASSIIKAAMSREGLDASIEINGNNAQITVSQKDYLTAENALEDIGLKIEEVYISNSANIGMVKANDEQIGAMLQGMPATPEERAVEYNKNFAIDANAIAAETENGSLLDSVNAQEANLGSFEGAVESAEEVEDALEACLD